MPSSKSAPENDIPIARVAVNDSGVLASSKRSIDQLRGDQLLVVDHHSQERLEVFPRRFHGELAQPLDAFGGIGREQVDTQAARTHQHQPACVVGVVECEPHRGAAAQRIAHQRNTSQAQLIEQAFQRPRRVVVELPVLGPLVRVPVAGLVDGQHMKLLSQHRDIA